MGERRRRINKICHRLGLGLAGVGFAAALCVLVAAQGEADAEERSELTGAAIALAVIGVAGYAGLRTAGWFVAELVD
jgi:hypothetical protein